MPYQFIDCLNFQYNRHCYQIVWVQRVTKQNLNSNENRLFIQWNMLSRPLTSSLRIRSIEIDVAPSVVCRVLSKGKQERHHPREYLGMDPCLFRNHRDLLLWCRLGTLYYTLVVGGGGGGLLLLLHQLVTFPVVYPIATAWTWTSCHIISAVFEGILNTTPSSSSWPLCFPCTTDEMKCNAMASFYVNKNKNTFNCVDIELCFEFSSTCN